LQITGLQNQVTMLLASQRSAAEGSSKLAALEGVIERLQATLSHISAMAGKAAQENQALLCENQQLAAERAQLQQAVQQLQVRFGTDINRVHVTCMILF
jgi:regulator of replication initiation timing